MQLNNDHSGMRNALSGSFTLPDVYLQQKDCKVYIGSVEVKYLVPNRLQTCLLSSTGQGALKQGANLRSYVIAQNTVVDMQQCLKSQPPMQVHILIGARIGQGEKR